MCEQVYLSFRPAASARRVFNLTPHIIDNLTVGTLVMAVPEPSGAASLLMGAALIFYTLIF